MNFDAIQALRDAVGERRSKAEADILNEEVSKAGLRRFLEHVCERCEIDMCRYSYEVMAADALIQLDGVFVEVIRALDLAVGVLELSGEFPEAMMADLQRFDRDFLSLRMSRMDSILEQVTALYDFCLDVYGELDDSEDFEDFDLAA
jgi:hypothetical protein